MNQIFISYSRKDSPCAERICQDLNSAGYDAWKDTRKILFGSRWFRTIEEAVKQSQAIVVLWSQDAENSFWVGEEILCAIDYGKPIIPVCIDGTPLKTPLRSYHSLTATSPCVDTVSQLLPHVQSIVESTASPNTQVKLQQSPSASAEADGQRYAEPERRRAERRRGRVVNPTVRPEIGDLFHDRTSAIDWFRAVLAKPDTRLLAIIGREGFGKTALTARLLAEAEQGMISLDRQDIPVVGVAYFHPVTTQLSLDQLCIDLGILLGQPYADNLTSIRNSTDDPPVRKAHRLLNELIRACEEDGVIFVVMDGLEKVLNAEGEFLESHKEIALWLEACLNISSPVKVIVTSRQEWSPPGMGYRFLKQWFLSEGLPEDDALALLLELEAVRFEPTEVEVGLLRKVARLTSGAPMALVKIAGLLRQRKREDLQRLVEDVSTFDKDIISSVSNYAYGQLRSDEQGVMEVLAVFRFPVPERAIAYVLQGQMDEDAVGGALESLGKRYFVGYFDQQATWSIHDSDRRAVQTRLQARNDDYISLHRRAAQYYEKNGLDEDRLNAAFHWQQTDEYERAVELTTTDVWSLISDGQSVELRRRLEQFTAEQLDILQWIQVQVGLGDVYRFLSEVDLARTSYQTALDLLEASEQSPEMRLLQARCYLGLGDLARQTSLSESYAWLQKGLDVLDGAEEPLLMAELQIKMGTVQAETRHYAESILATNAGLALLPEGDSQLWVRGLINLGRSHFWGEHDIERGLSYTKDAQEMAERIKDWYWSLKALNNLALFYDISGQWKKAIETYELALEKEELIGSPPAEALQLANNISFLYTNMGEHAKARTQVERAEAIARAHGLERDLAYVLAGRADLAERLENWNEAASCLAEAEQLTDTTGAEELKPELCYLWSNAYRGLGQLDKAIDYAQRSLALAEDPMSDGKAQRALAQALLASGQVEPALAAFERSLSLLQEQDPYETARTQASYGQVLVDRTDPARGQALLQQARSAFARLGVIST